MAKSKLCEQQVHAHSSFGKHIDFASLLISRVYNNLKNNNLKTLIWGFLCVLQV